MRTIRFHRSLYAPAAVSQAVAVFAEYGQLRVEESSPEHVVVHVVGADPGQEDALVGAFANYALGVSAHQQQPE